MGFTLVELIVALAILAAVMTGLIMLFTGSLRAVQTGYQSMDAYEQARAAMAVIERDLTTSFGTRDYADYYNFYGTPVGMTFIGVTRNPDKQEDINIARITYVVYNKPVLNPDGNEIVFPDALIIDETNNITVHGYPYYLIRYIEPGVSDLESFPLPWLQGNPELDMQPLLDMIETEYIHFRNFSAARGQYTAISQSEEEQLKEDFVRAKRREYWIRALAGGDAQMPLDFWTMVLPGLRRSAFEIGKVSDADLLEICSPRNYAVATNVLSVSPAERQLYWDRGFSFFGYNFSTPETILGDGSLIEIGNSWWNDPRSVNCDPQANKNPADFLGVDLNDQFPRPVTFCRQPGLPQLVNVSFWLMFESPYPGAPDFKRMFSQQIFIPTAYDRGSINNGQ